MKNNLAHIVSNWKCQVAAIAVVASSLTTFSTSAAEMLAGIAENGRLVMFASDAPDDVAVVKVRGLAACESILGMDVRPATGEVYALGSSSRLYKLNVLTGQATPVGSGPFTPALTGQKFGFDFNPTVDRIRIVSDSGQNLRAHPDTGAVVATDGTLAYATNDVAAGLVPTIVAAAYINNDTNPATGTVLFDIDAGTDTLVMQNPPNNGTLITVGTLGINVTSVAGFDVAGSDGTAYAALVEAAQPGRSARASLYTIDLASGQAVSLGKIGGPKSLTSLTALGTID